MIQPVGSKFKISGTLHLHVELLSGYNLCKNVGLMIREVQPALQSRQAHPNINILSLSASPN